MIFYNVLCHWTIASIDLILRVTLLGTSHNPAIMTKTGAETATTRTNTGQPRGGVQTLRPGDGGPAGHGPPGRSIPFRARARPGRRTAREEIPVRCHRRGRRFPSRTGRESPVQWIRVERRNRCGHQRRDVADLHVGVRRRGQADQGPGDVPRWRRHGGVADQRRVPVPGATVDPLSPNAAATGRPEVAGGTGSRRPVCGSA